MSNRLHALDAVRGAAALAVVAYHYTGWHPGVYGVEVFFAASGWLIARGLLDRPTSYADHLRRRAARLVPGYWVWAVIVTLVFASKHPPPLLAHLTFLAGCWPWGQHPANVAWSLTPEAVWYLLAPWLVRRPKLLMLGTVALVVGALGGSHLCRAWAIGVGAVLAVDGTELPRLPRVPGLEWVGRHCLGVYLWHTVGLWLALGWGLPAASGLLFTAGAAWSAARWVEQPGRRLLLGWTSPSPGEPAASSGPR